LPSNVVGKPSINLVISGSTCPSCDDARVPYFHESGLHDVNARHHHDSTCPPCADARVPYFRESGLRDVNALPHHEDGYACHHHDSTPLPHDDAHVPFLRANALENVSPLRNDGVFHLLGNSNDACLFRDT